MNMDTILNSHSNGRLLACPCHISRGPNLGTVDRQRQSKIRLALGEKLAQSTSQPDAFI